MRFSLKMLLACVLVVGLCSGWLRHRIELNKPTKVAIRYEVVKGSNPEYTVPSTMIMWRKPKLYREMRALAIDQLPPTDEELLDQILDDPTKYTWYDERHRVLVRRHRDRVEKGLEKFLNQPVAKAMYAVARLYAELGERRGFDAWRSEFLKTFDMGFISNLGGFTKAWWENDVEIKAVLEALFQDATVGDKYAVVRALRLSGERQPWIDYYYQEAKRTDVPQYEKIYSLACLAEEEVSLRSLALVRELLESAREGAEFHFADLLDPYCQAKDPEVRKQALAICEQYSYAEDDPAKQEKYPRRHDGSNYYRKLCDYGGAEYVDYFQRYAKGQRYLSAMRALVRIWPKERAAEFAKQLGHDAIVTELLGEEALGYLLNRPTAYRHARLMVQAANGKPFPEGAQAIADFLTKSDDLSYFEGRKLIYLLDKLGHSDADSFRSYLPDPPKPFNAEQHWIKHDLTQQQLLDFLNSEKVGKQLARKDVYQQLEDNGMSADGFANDDLFALVDGDVGYNPREFMLAALEAAGVARQCDVLETLYYVPNLVGTINRSNYGQESTKQNIRKDKRLWAAPTYDPPSLFVTFEKRTFEVQMAEDETHPVFAAEALNTMLAEYTEFTKRFYVYVWFVDGWDEHYVAYLEPSVAAKLEKDFCLIPFPMSE